MSAAGNANSTAATATASPSSSSPSRRGRRGVSVASPLPLPRSLFDPSPEAAASAEGVGVYDPGYEWSIGAPEPSAAEMASARMPDEPDEQRGEADAYAAERQAGDSSDPDESHCARRDTELDALTDDAFLHSGGEGAGGGSSVDADLAAQEAMEAEEQAEREAADLDQHARNADADAAALGSAAAARSASSSTHATTAPAPSASWAGRLTQAAEWGAASQTGQHAPETTAAVAPTATPAAAAAAAAPSFVSPSAAAALAEFSDVDDDDLSDSAFLRAPPDPDLAAWAAAPLPTATDSPLYAPAAKALQKHWGYPSFRLGQFQLIEAVVNQRRDAFVLMATGGGKSLCFQLLPLLSGKPCVVISPLISLMQDQVVALQQRGITACALNSHTADPRVARDAFNGKYQLIYMSPERFVQSIASLSALESRVGLSAFAIDESHCLSEWGHDFRAEYRNLGAIRTNFPRVPIVALTATATPTVAADIVQSLGMIRPMQIKTTFNRPNLFLQVKMAQGIKKDFTRALVGDDKEACIIYVQTRADTEAIAAHLKSLGINAHAYHAALSADTRNAVHAGFIHDKIRVVVATVAFGMGIDHAEIRRVINYGLVKNLESLVQMTGRAGRDGQPAECTLFYSTKDYAMVRFWSKGSNEAQMPDTAASAARANAVSRAFDKMKDYVTSSLCRRVLILSYFGEDWRRDAPRTPVKGVPDKRGRCNHCDNCLRVASREFAASQAAASAASTSSGSSAASASSSVSSVCGVDYSHIYYFALAAHETGEKNGMAYLCSFLKGSKSAKILERAEWARVKPLSKCQSYGKLAREDSKYLGAVGRWLLQVGVLEQVYRNEFAIVVLGPEGKRILDGGPGAPPKGWAPKNADMLPPELQQEVDGKLKKEKARAKGRASASNAAAKIARTIDAAAESAESPSGAPGASASGIPPESALLTALLDLRSTLSKSRDIAPYLVFSRGELEWFAKLRPTSLQRMAMFSGVTPNKLAAYGADFIRTITHFAAQFKLPTDLPLPPQLQQRPSDAAAAGGAAVGGSLSAAVGDVLSYVDYLKEHRAASASDQLSSVAANWPHWPAGVMTRVSVQRSDNCVEYPAHKPPKRLEIWTAVHTLAHLGLDAVAKTINVDIAALIKNCASVVEDGLSYRWERFNIPDSFVSRVQCVGVEVEVMARREPTGTGVLQGQLADANHVGLWAAPYLRHFKARLPEMFQYEHIQLIVAHLRRLYGAGGPRRVHKSRPATEAMMEVDDEEAPHSKLAVGGAPLLSLEAKYSRPARGPVSLSSSASSAALPAAASAAASSSPIPSSSPAAAAVPSMWMPRRSASLSSSQPAPRQHSAVHAAASASAAASAISRPMPPLSRQPSSLATHLRPLYDLSSSSVHASRCLTSAKLRVLELFQSGQSIAQVSATCVLRTSTCVQYLSDMVLHGYEINWLQLSIAADDEAAVLRLLDGPPSLLPPVSTAALALIPTIQAIKKRVREEVSKEQILMLISKRMQHNIREQTNSDKHQMQETRMRSSSLSPVPFPSPSPLSVVSPLAPSSASVAASSSCASAASRLSGVSADAASMPPLERPEPMQLSLTTRTEGTAGDATHTGDVTAAMASSLPSADASACAAAAAAAATASAGSSPLKRRAAVDSLESPEKRSRASLSIPASAPVSASAVTSLLPSSCGAASPVSLAPSSASSTHSDRSPVGPVSGSTNAGSKHCATHPIRTLQATQHTTQQQTRHTQAVDADTSDAAARLLPLTSSSILALLTAGPRRLEQLCAALIPVGGHDVWSQLPKLQGLLAQLAEDGSIFKRNDTCRGYDEPRAIFLSCLDVDSSLCFVDDS